MIRTIAHFFQRRTLVQTMSLTLGVVLLSASLAACITGDDDTPSKNDGVTMSTFTPVPPDYTPPVVLTREAAREQVAKNQTATAAAPTSTPGPTRPPSTPGNTGDIVFPTPPAEGDDVVYPPSAVLTTSVGNYVGATVGTYNWFEESAQSGGTFQAQWIELSEDTVVTVAGDDATILFEEGSPEPVTTVIDIFTAEGNVSIPTNLDGTPSQRLVFVQQQDPVYSTTIEGPDLTFRLDVGPNLYFVRATVIWPAVEGTEEWGDQKTEYLFRVTVE